MYDRACLGLSSSDVAKKLEEGVPYTIRLKVSLFTHDAPKTTRLLIPIVFFILDSCGKNYHKGYNSGICSIFT
jgi:hypothetical protein